MQRQRPNESRDKDSSSTKFKRPARRADERVEVRETFGHLDGKLSLKADEQQVVERHEDVGR